LSANDGLSDLTVTSIFKDSEGYVWIGTGSSIDRFDGIHVVNRKWFGAVENVKRVYAITQDADGCMWVGTGVGLWRMNADKSKLERIAENEITTGVHALLYDDKHTLYIGTEQGLWIYRDGKLAHILPDSNPLSESNFIRAMTFDGQHRLWMASARGFFMLNKNQIQPAPLRGNLLNNYNYNGITGLHDHLYLATTDRGLLCYNPQINDLSPMGVEVGSNVISALADDGKDVLYVGTDGNGVHYVSVSERRVLRSFVHQAGQEEGLRSNSVYSLLVDREGLLWVGLYQLGLDYSMYQRPLFTRYTLPNFDTKDMPVRTLCIHDDERLIGSRDGLYFIRRSEGLVRDIRMPQLRSNTVISSCYYHGEYYIGTFGGGMSVFNPATGKIRDFEPAETNPFQSGHVFVIRVDANDVLWIGTNNGVYCYANGRQIAHYTEANSKLPVGNVYEIYFDSTRRGWICTETGMAVWNPSTQSLMTDVFPEGFPSKEKMRVVYEDSSHELYFLPDKGGMFVSDLTLSHYHRMMPHTPLDGRDLMSIIEDEDHWLWIGTSNGMFRYDKKETFVPYTFADGIPSPMFINCYPVKTNDGTIWFGNSKGLLKLKWNPSVTTDKCGYPIAVTNVWVNGRKASLSPVQTGSKTFEVALGENQNNITVDISGFSYTHPSYMSYQCRMEGVDEDWQMLEQGLSPSYFDLSAGTHVLHIRQAGEPDTEITLAVHVPVSPWVWGLTTTVGLLLFGVALMGYKKKKNALESVEMTTETLEEEAEAPVPVEEVPAEEAPAESNLPEKPEKYKANKISDEECKRLAEALGKLMREQKPYANPELKIADLAEQLGTTAHTLSYLFNQYLHGNYYDYVNEYRVAEFKRLINDEDCSRYTIAALAERCGFSSRASFFRNFKKATGITPNEYIQSLGKSLI
jgi:ligand-binding sensor domain-containing protein/AraC-like DNA-binding protein